MNQQTAPRGPAHLTRPVHGLEHSRDAARSHGRRRRRANAATTGVLIVLAAGSVGTAGYFAWTEFLREEPAPTTPRRDMTPAEAIEILEQQPHWNGPGNPNFGVGNQP